MSEKPWLLPTDTPAAPRVCHCCGDPLPERGGIFAQPHWYHRGCYTALHVALWAKGNEGRTLAAVRAMVAADVRKGRTG